MLVSEVSNKHIQDLEEQRLELQKQHGRTFGWLVFIPILIGILAGLISRERGVFLLAGGVAAVISFITHSFLISSPFDKIKTQLKEVILKDLMDTFHPDVEFYYSEYKQEVREITREADLVSANRYHEEDVLRGLYGNTEFYISEIHLEKKRDKSTKTVFDGLLFKIRVPGKSFPRARIISHPGLLSKIFGGYLENEEFGFYFDSQNHRKFYDELGHLFPFIRHLIHKNRDVRISVDGDEIVMFLNSNMEFLDDPVPRLNEPLLNSDYIEKFAQQLNSLLFIVETLSNDLNTKEIEDRLELKAIEYVKQIEKS